MLTVEVFELCRVMAFSEVITISSPADSCDSFGLEVKENREEIIEANERVRGIVVSFWEEIEDAEVGSEGPFT